MKSEVKLIESNALFKKLVDTDPNTRGRFCDGVATALAFILNAPAIDPESLRPKGRWMAQEWNDMWQSMTATCSHCLERGEVRVRTNEHGMKVINSPSCPNCGAKMEV